MTATILTIQPETRNETAEQSYRLYYAHRHAKAAWDLALYSAEYIDNDLPNHINDPLSDANSGALNEFLLAPAGDAKQLAKKLAVFRDEEIWLGWNLAREITASLAEDAHSIAYPEV